MNGCRHCRGTGIAQYRMLYGGPRVPVDTRCAHCGTRWFVRDGLVVVEKEPVQALGEGAQLGGQGGVQH